MRIEANNPKEVAEEAFWLAWQACGGPMGMGVLQRRPGATKQDVLKCAKTNGDYAGDFRILPQHTIDGDYVFGRMMKLQIKFDDRAVFVPDTKPRPDYQAWSCKYATYENLIEQASRSLSTQSYSES